jgi:hypothetical protein
MSLVLFASVSYSSPNRLYVMDTPTTNILNYGSYDANFRIFSGGGLQTRLNFGVLKMLNVGVSWELDNFIGNDQLKMAVPALSVKLRLYDGNMTWPGIALGYDGQGYFYNSDYDGDYLQRGKGIYLVVGREMFFEGLMIDAGLNMNDFSKTRIYGFVNAVIPLYQDSLFFMAEYDNINYFPEARINAGIRYALTDSIDLDFMMRDCWGKDAADKIPNERVFKINYSGKF